jgi:hypothetical protein
MLAARCIGLVSAPAVNLAALPDQIGKELKITDELSTIIGITLRYADTRHPQNKFRSPGCPFRGAVTFRRI